MCTLSFTFFVLIRQYPLEKNELREIDRVSEEITTKIFTLGDTKFIHYLKPNLGKVNCGFERLLNTRSGEVETVI